ncbi:HxlR family transcriptional regulator [Rathayibacter tanaceti]|uniref:Transcriptional regulator n=2 Tax=Rathayibacter tanaceti TaxID=1671680 RepID=A0A166H988_9MICO|nr:helix-turn-helix domain-containing protein [Rathayibacter tanaceti]KZX20182.1 putative HTH-type transcriptional regulator YtcD [Rathayibacter tanaceti]QHC56526.1 transcriptional regulator [Rathayibacter tanaceti]TCO36739.1 HxlR family transcriptional regulator [Rathayibacter tanaceti]
MTTPAITPRDCPIASGLEVLGERWSLLVLREIAFGERRFDRIQAFTGAPRDVLTARLRSLEEHGVIERVAYSDRPPRFEYRFTEAGRDAVPVLIALAAWGERWACAPSARQPYEHRCGARLDPQLHCAECGERMDADSVSLAP